MECGCGWSGGHGERRKEDAWDEDKKGVIWGHHESSVKPLRERQAGPEPRRGWKGERGGVGGDWELRWPSGQGSILKAKDGRGGGVC